MNGGWMDREQNKHIAGDRALKPGEIDRLGFRDIAGRIAGALVDHASDSGIVVGLNGSWGSGKSSLLTLIEEELQKLPTEKRPTVISFKPWLVGNRDALLWPLRFWRLANASGTASSRLQRHRPLFSILPACVKRQRAPLSVYRNSAAQSRSRYFLFCRRAVCPLTTAGCACLSQWL